MDARRAREVNERLGADWDGMKGRIAAIMRPAAELERVLRRAGAPTTSAELGWPAAFYAHAASKARLIRNRYTFLDLAANCGIAIEP